LNLNRSYLENIQNARPSSLTAIEEAYLLRLAMELVNIGMEEQIRLQGNPQKIAILQRLIQCEGSFWQ
jgi:hypothetical protein